MTNIERFDQLTGKLFAVLFESFPMTIDLTGGAFNDTILTAPDDSEEWKDQLFARDEFFISTVAWLINAGYISHDIQGSRQHNIFRGCTLTAKALEVLKAVPDTLTGKSIGASLQAAASAGLMDTVKSLTGKALGIGASMGYSAASSWINP